ncbi:MAG TPA: FAD-dependent monooxygenase [Polyangiaceae bacterium]|nr:FAD-dependent monooxygenase [Polyangiaceae bacterium]
MSTPTLNSRTSILVVGAGPAGLVAAVTLRERGVAVRIIDEQASDEKRTYPVIIHPRSSRILDTLGVVAPLEWRGHTITRLAVYTEGQRRAVLQMPAAGRTSSGATTLPQDVLRQALLHRLSELGVEVEWKTRLVALEQYAGHVRCNLIRRERLEAEKLEWFDVESASIDSDYVIGADGVRSSVRDRLGIGWIPRGPRQIFAFYDAPDDRAGPEAHLVIHESQGNSVYPLQSNVSRFAFQLSVAMPRAPSLTQLHQLLASRMPWYGRANATSFEWSGCAEFQPALAERFGEGRVWLAGDAAHSTGPLGGQSLNVGMHEARDLALRMAQQLGQPGAAPLGVGYAQQRAIEWQVLFGLAPSAPLTPQAGDWVKRNLPLLLQALPASGDDLDDLLDQLHVRAA